MNNEKGYTVVELITALGILAVLIFLGGGVYVVCHFIAKSW